MAKRKSLFDDNTVEIQELTYIIKQDIGNLNKQIAQLQQVCGGFCKITVKSVWLCHLTMFVIIKSLVQHKLINLASYVSSFLNNKL